MSEPTQARLLELFELREGICTAEYGAEQLLPGALCSGAPIREGTAKSGWMVVPVTSIV